MKKEVFIKLEFALSMILLVSMVSACVPGSTTTTEAVGTESLTTETPETNAPTTEEQTAEESTAEPEKVIYKVDEGSPLENLPYYDYDAYKDYWDMEKGAEMLLFTAESSDGYTRYLTDLTAAGFSLYAENEIVGNLYSTWTKDELIVTMMHMPNLNSTRIVVEPLSNGLASRESENTYTDAGYENLILQIGTRSTIEKNYGMCYAYRLCDGSFIVADMGYSDQVMADRIYETLAKYAPDPNNIVIAAFFVSHAHIDHYGGFENFSETYTDKVTIEKIIYNYHNEKSMALAGVSTGALYALEDHAAKWDGVELIEAHPGQEFFIRDAYIEMLYTWEMFETDEIPYLNNSGIIFSVTLENTKIMQLGDCGPLVSPILLTAYGDYLDSDIIQVAHHGLIGATAELNAEINAEVILYPSSDFNFRRCQRDPRNEIFRDAEFIYPADKYVYMIPLPFDAERIERWEIFEY